MIQKNEHFCQILPTLEAETCAKELLPHTSITRQDTSKSQTQASKSHFASSVNLDPDCILPDKVRREMSSIMIKYDSVFDPNIKGYNHSAGHFEAVVNMGPVQPPQRKGRCPQYSRDKLVELQETFDKLQANGVFCRPEDMNITVEYLNPSFLVKKASGGHRLVTAFADVGRFCKPSPSMMPDVDSTLRSIACWKYIIITDLTSAFYQIPLSVPSMKYCGVVTPYKGVLIYKRSAMGMPGSETALEELLCRVMGSLLQEGVVAKLADDLYCGGNTPAELISNWERVLQALDASNLKLSANKTIVCPKSATILGWVWTQGSIKASPHRIASLSLAKPPATVKGLRSYIGAYKVLGRVLPGCSMHVAPLDDSIANLSSKDKVEWTDDLLASFHKSQAALQNNKSITLPRPDDQLWIVTDGSVKQRGLGSTLYVARGPQNKIMVAGFYSAKPKKHQVTWLPCEIEALSIAGAIQHFSPYIVQSKKKTCILTDSKPCVQSFEKLCRGEFSSSPRVTSFLSIASRYQVTLQHLSGSANIPSDFASRNAPDCTEPSCQICTFIALMESSVVRTVTSEDIISGKSSLPYTSRNAWKSIQADCPDLRRVHAHLQCGTRPSKKSTDISDIKRYLQVATISSDGLVIVKKYEPLAPTKELIVVPKQIVPGLLTALHIKLHHPSKHQLKIVFQRHFHALTLDTYIADTVNSCHTCAALKKIPEQMCHQTSEDPPECVGISFAADVLKRNRQTIFVLRETVTSYTVSRLLENEKHESLREAIISSCLELRSLDGPNAVIRVDSAPGFIALERDKTLERYHITLDYGRVKNPNKNPVAERTIQELEDELLKVNPDAKTVTPLLLAVTTARLNSRIRGRGLSAREMFMLRDQFNNSQLPVSDRVIIESQSRQRTINHPYSERSKSGGCTDHPSPPIQPGDLVYLIRDKNKCHARDRYIVSTVDGTWCFIKKFVNDSLRSSSYKVKLSECYLVPKHTFDMPLHTITDNDGDDIYSEHQPSQDLPPPQPSHELPPPAPADPAHPPPTPPEPPEVLMSPYEHEEPLPMHNIAAQEDYTTQHEHMSEHTTDHHQTRKDNDDIRVSNRMKQKPSWMSEDWEFS